MRHGSLFSGIGGFDLAARWMGWDNVFHVEWNPWCRKVLEYHFPNSQSFTDVKQFDGSAWRGRVDIISGGFPCQPYSAAGKRLGKDDERHLWPEMLRIIREAAPAYVVGENVRGLINWNGGVVFEEVCVDLENSGFEVWAGVLPSASVGAPHRRDRVWFVAHATSRIQNVTDTNGKRRLPLSKEMESEKSNGNGFIRDGGERNVANANGKRLQRGEENGNFASNGPERNEFISRHVWTTWKNFPTQPPVCGGNDGLPRQLDGITFSKWRNESIKAYGNAIVPQVAYEIFKAISNTHKQ